jgi:hypothetical protein
MGRTVLVKQVLTEVREDTNPGGKFSAACNGMPVERVREIIKQILNNL